MDNSNCNTNHLKGQHLTSEERHDIEVHLKDGRSINKIARRLGRSDHTIKDEIERGTVILYNGKVKRYKADVGEQVYRQNRQSSTWKYCCLETAQFLQYVVKQFNEQGRSLDACVGNALANGTFSRNEMVCTKTLYNYVDLGLLPIKSIDLPEKLHRNTKRKETRESRKNLGKSIEERPESVENRAEFGHWEPDSVLGKKSKDDAVVLTLVERKLKMCLWLKAADHSAESVAKAIQALKQEYGERFSDVFKTITTDNGSEFADLSKEETEGTKVCFTNPFS